MRFTQLDAASMRRWLYGGTDAYYQGNNILGRWNSLNKAYMGYLGKDEIL